MSIFDNNVEIYESWFKRHPLIFKNELKLLKAFIQKNQNGLEVGVGTGRFASLLHTRIGLDESYNMLVHARKRGVEAVQGRGENLPFRDFEFDYVSIIVTICFVKSPEEVFAEAYRVTNEKGRVFVAFIESKSKYGEYYKAHASYNIFYRYANFYTANEIEELMEKAGFKVIERAQTLFNEPGVEVDEPWDYGVGKGSFILLVGEKSIDNKNPETH